MSIKYSKNAEELIDKIVELKAQLDYQIVELCTIENQDIIHYQIKELIQVFETLKYNYPEDSENFITNNPKYKPIEKISADNSIGLSYIIDSISEDTDQTVAKIVKQVQTHEFYKWVKKNIKQEIIELCDTKADETLYVHLSEFNLPQVKQEEIGDCIALAFAGILSDNASVFNDAEVKEADKQRLLRELMVKNRKYLNWDFKSLTIEDQTEQYSTRKTLYKPRGVAASKMIDSTYTDGKHLFAVVSTSNSDTTSQGAQAFEIYKTLQSNYEKNSLKISDDTNLEPSVILFNNAFFCTESPEKVEHSIGNSNEKRKGYHPLNLRKKFDDLYENKLSKSSLDKINGLTTLSMLGNNEISWPRFPHTFDICDLIYCNPITAGADTLWLHTKFEQFKIYDNPQKTQKFFNFLLDYSNEIADYLLQAKSNANEPILGEIKSSFERMIAGITRNFNSYNLKRELNESEIKKIESLYEKIMDFNINQPNQAIDPNLFSSLTIDSFKNRGLLNTQIIERRKVKFEKIKQQEKENKQLINNEIKAAILEDSNSSSIFKKLDELSNYIYTNDKQGKKLKISTYINIILKNIELSEKHNCTYFNIPKSENPNYNYKNNFLSNGGNVRNNFNNKILEKEKINYDLARALENADQMICDYLRTFETEEGRLTIIEEGGMLSFTEKLCKHLEEYVKVIKNSEVDINYENYQKNTPYSPLKRKDLGSYWNSILIKTENSNDFQEAIGMLHEYLNRIENQFDSGEKVSGRSFSDLPKKIFSIKELAGNDPLVLNAIENVIERYNYLGDLFAEQNRNNKRYKPKDYKIKLNKKC